MKSRVAAIAVAALFAAACGDGDTAAPVLVTTTSSPATSAPLSPSSVDSTTTTSNPAAVVIEQVDCPSGLERSDGLRLACGSVTVPLDPADTASGTTTITVAALAGSDADRAIPLAVLQGGPGGASTEMGSWFPQQPFTQVFVDQRGTGFLGPDFDCPEVVDAIGAALAVGSTEAGGIADAAYDECARRLRGDAVLAHTDSEAHAADVVAVMGALGYTSWAAYGVSYGTTVGLEILRDAPTGIVGVVLDGVYPPELDTEVGLVGSAERAVDEIDAECAADPTCASFLPDGSFRSTLERVMAELDESPMVVELSDNQLGYSSDVDVVLDGRRVAEFTFLLTYQESLLRHLPAVIGGLDDRDRSSARWLARTGARLLIAAQGANDEGTYFAVQCHDRLPFTDGPGDDLTPFAAAVAAAGLVRGCEEWDREPAGAAVDDPVESSIPTLLLSGSFDPITPPEYADSVGERLVASTSVEQGGRGHGIWYGSDCIATIVDRFVEDPTAVLDTACAADPVPVEWARP